MKPQDIAFLLLFIVISISRKEKWFVLAGLASFMFAMPLFAKWIFFTAERSVWYGAAFLFTALCLYAFQTRKAI